MELCNDVVMSPEEVEAKVTNAGNQVAAGEPVIFHAEEVEGANGKKENDRTTKLVDADKNGSNGSIKPGPETTKEGM